MPAHNWKFTNPRGQQLHAVQYLPAGPPQAVLVFHHGYAEHVGRKADVFDQLADAGIAVYSYDMHGHGQSEPIEDSGRAMVQDWRHMARQMHAESGQPTSPNWFVGGYSVGGMTAAHAALRQPDQWAGLVLASAALGLEKHGLVVRIQSALAGLLMATVPTRKIVKGMVTAHLNPDQTWVASYDADPLCYHDKVRVCTAYNFAQGIEALKQQQSKLNLPVYILHATGDKITPYAAVKEWGDALPNVHYRSVEGAYHDLLSGGGTAQQLYVTEMIDWLNSIGRMEGNADGPEVAGHAGARVEGSELLN